MKRIILFSLVMATCAVPAHAGEGNIEETTDSIIVEFTGTGENRANPTDLTQPTPEPPPEPQPEPPPLPVEEPPPMPPDGIMPEPKS